MAIPGCSYERRTRLTLGKQDDRRSQVMVRTLPICGAYRELTPLSVVRGMILNQKTGEIIFHDERRHPPALRIQPLGKQQVFEAVSALNAQQFTRDLGGSFHSVRDTLVHIIGGEWSWLAYWKEPNQNPAFLKELRNRQESLFNPAEFPDIIAVRQKWAEIEREQTEFVNCLTDEALGKPLPLRAIQVSLMLLMQHLANHSTYHRGQVALMLRQLGAEPVATDFHLFLVERSRKDLC